MRPLALAWPHAAAAVALAALASVAPARPAGAQRPDSSRAELLGTVRDVAGAPVTGAAVAVDGGAWTPVAATGDFRVGGLSAGPHVLRVRAVGFRAIQGAVTLPAGPLAVDVTLERAVARLDTVRTLASAATEYGPPEFRERRAHRYGYYLTRDEFERNVPSRLTDLLIRAPGVERKVVEDQVGSSKYVIVMRGVSTVKGEICPVNVYVDGRNFDVGADDLDRLVRPSDVEAMEVYAGSSHLPPRFAGPTARCGVIALWTRGTAH